MITKPKKPSVCPCGVRFTKLGLKPWHPYHNAACALKHKTGNVPTENLHQLDHSVLFQVARGAFQKHRKEVCKGMPCISCSKVFGKSDMIHAGHLYPAKQFPGLVFDPDNVWPQCDFCNCGKDGNEEGYRAGLMKLKGQEFVHELDARAQLQYVRNYKHSRGELIEIIIRFSESRS